MCSKWIYVIAVVLAAALVQTGLGAGLDPNLVAW